MESKDGLQVTVPPLPDRRQCMCRLGGTHKKLTMHTIQKLSGIITQLLPQRIAVRHGRRASGYIDFCVNMVSRIDFPPRFFDAGASAHWNSTATGTRICTDLLQQYYLYLSVQVQYSTVSKVLGGAVNEI